MPVSAAVLCFIGLGGFGYYSVLFFVTLFRPIYFIDFVSLLPKRLASPASSQRHNKSLNTGVAIRSRSLFNPDCSQPVKQTLKHMRKFRNSLLITAFFISIPSMFLLYIGAARINMFNMMFGSGMLVLWWCAYFNIHKDRKWSFGLSFGLVNLFWWPLLWQTTRRILFIFENGGLDGSNGYGSPLAFLVGMAGEQLLFLPLCLSMLFGTLVIKSFNK